MKYIRIIPLLIGWGILTLGCLVFYAATGLGWLGENIMNLAFEGGLGRGE